MQEDAGNGRQASDGKPIYIALVDLTCGVDFLELVKSGLLAALEAVPPASVFGLVTFSHKVDSVLVWTRQSCFGMPAHAHASGIGPMPHSECYQP